MTKTAFAFAGQGAQFPGMAQKVYDRYSAAQRVFKRSEEVLGKPIRQWCFNGSAEFLGRTMITQVAVTVASLAILEAYRDRSSLSAQPETEDYEVGHSLGELIAARAAGGISEDDTFLLAEARGDAMEEAGRLNPGKMATIIAPAETVEAVAAKHGVFIAAYNTDTITTISGETKKIEAAAGELEAVGARVYHQPISIAAHTELMGPGVPIFTEAVETKTFDDLKVPSVANLDGKLVQMAGVIKAQLPDQLRLPVRFKEGTELLLREGVTRIVEFSPKQVLASMYRNHAGKRLKVVSAETILVG